MTDQEFCVLLMSSDPSKRDQAFKHLYANCFEVLDKKWGSIFVRGTSKMNKDAIADAFTQLHEKILTGEFECKGITACCAFVKQQAKWHMFAFWRNDKQNKGVEKYFTQTIYQESHDEGRMRSEKEELERRCGELAQQNLGESCKQLFRNKIKNEGVKLTRAELASRLNLSESAYKKRLTRCRNEATKLRAECMKQYQND